MADFLQKDVLARHLFFPLDSIPGFISEESGRCFDDSIQFLIIAKIPRGINYDQSFGIENQLPSARLIRDWDQINNPGKSTVTKKGDSDEPLCPRSEFFMASVKSK
ncbi:MAG: hypothetical protein ACREDR_06860, partial [Blastocatellia bacterium]